jgi:hypothetical protein
MQRTSAFRLVFQIVTAGNANRSKHYGRNELGEYDG